MKQSALHPVHLQLNAKMIDFQGWQMPFQYAGTAEEHLAVRTAAGLFDVSHLGRIEITGPGGAGLLQKSFTRDVLKLSEGAATYGLFCNTSGLILDDALLFHLPKGQSGLPAPQPDKFQVYVLECADKSLYKGYSKDIDRRLKDHEEGKVSWTAPRRPVRLVYFEEYDTEAEAIKREDELKTGFGREWLKKILASRQAGDRYLLSTNAVNTDKMVSWLKQNADQDVQITDRTQTMAQIALQGPSSDSLFDKIAGHHVKKLRPKNVRELPLAGTPVTVSRTGYTGEHGYEFFVPVDHAEALWTLIMQAGKESGLAPCGLAARDVLRLEMGYVMYGYDIDEKRNPIEAGLGAVVDLKKEFIGKEALLAQKAAGITRRLAGFVLLEKEIPRNGGSIFSENREIGAVTSAVYSPSVRKGIGLGYVLTRYAQPGQEVEIEVRDREIAAKIAELPFYKKK